VTAPAPEPFSEIKTLCDAMRSDAAGDDVSPCGAATFANPAEKPSDGPFDVPPTEPISRKVDAQTSCEDRDRWIDEKLAENDRKLNREEESRSAPSSPPPPPSRRGNIDLCLDRICLLWENTPGSVRFHLKTSRGCPLKDVELELSNPLYEKPITVRVHYIDDRSGLSNGGAMMGNLFAQFPAMGAGSYVWDVSLRFTQNGMRKHFASQFDLVVMGRGNAESIAERIVINIKNDINASDAADVHVSNRIAEELQGVLANKSENPFEVMRRYTYGIDRAWSYMCLCAPHPVLPPVPEEAKVESLSLDFGNRSLMLYAKRTVTFGRKHVDIVFGSPPEYTDEQKRPYGRISRQHCTFEHQGSRLTVCDGVLDENRMLKKSTNGTYWNGSRLTEPVSLGADERGVLSVAGCSFWNGVSLDAWAVSPKVACQNCPFANRQWCGNGRPSLVLTRRDGVPETYVCMWSCLHLGEIDGSFKGIILFRKDDAFAWGNEDECGWLVPGTEVKTANGLVKISTVSQKINKEGE